MSPIKDDRSDQPAISKTRITLLVALSVALAAWRISFFFDHFGGPKGATKLPEDNASYVAFVASAKQAEAISDPLQRCLRYPDLPGSHWNAETTKAYCELRNHPTIRLPEIEALLQQGKASDVDKTFQGYLDQQQRDPQHPDLLHQAFENAHFNESNTRVRTALDRWKQLAPDSAFALAASGLEYVNAAQKQRGNGWGKNLNDDQVSGMHQQLVLARTDLDHAAKRLPTITTTYAAMIYAGALEDDDDYLARAAARGLAVDPSNFYLRQEMMFFAQRKWGSHFGGVEQQKEQLDALTSTHPLLRILTSKPEVFRAICDCFPVSDITTDVRQAAAGDVSYSDLESLGDEAYNHQSPQLTIELYSESIRFKPNNVEALQWRANQQQRIGDINGAVEGLVLASQHFPNNEAIRQQLAQMYADVGKVKESENTFLDILKHQPDNLDAMAHLGDLYNHGGHQPDKAEVLADKLISEYPDRPEGYIVRACNQMDHNLPGRYETLHYFIDHYGDQPEWQSQTAEMRAYLKSHPEHAGTT